MTLADRLERALAETPDGRKLTKKGLAQACGIAAPSVTQWFNGRTKALEGANLLAAARYLEVSPDWLATGRGGMRDAARLSTGLLTTAAQSVRPDFDKLAAAVQLLHEYLSHTPFDSELLFDPHMLEMAYEGVELLGPSMDDSNVLDFMKYMKKRMEERSGGVRPVEDQTARKAAS